MSAIERVLVSPWHRRRSSRRRSGCGDGARAQFGQRLTVTPIEEEFLGQACMLALVDGSGAEWLTMPARRGGDVEVVRDEDAVG
jgi:hypothetical protein